MADNGLEHGGLEHRVRAALRAEVAEVRAPAALLAGVRRRYARRVAVRRVGFGAAAVGLAAAAFPLAVPVGTTLPPAPSALPSAGPVPQPLNAAYVREQVTKAVHAVAGSVVYERAVVTKGDKFSEPGQEALYERWLAADTSQFRLRVTIGGAPVADLSRGLAGDVLVDYRQRTYWSRPGVSDVSGFEEVKAPQQIAQDVAAGVMTVTGPGEPINGQATIKLRSDPAKAEIPLDLWVDAKTYVPVRFQFQQPDSAPFDLTWLPPTAENLAQLTTTVIPDGFRRIP
jgi:hypothetical protein